MNYRIYRDITDSLPLGKPSVNRKLIAGFETNGVRQLLRHLAPLLINTGYETMHTILLESVSGNISSTERILLVNYR